MSELVAAVLILLRIRIDLRRPWLGLLSATDASQVVGFGASVAAIRPCRARQFSRLSDRRHNLVRLQRDTDVFDELERNRQGVAHHVGIPSLISKLSVVNGPALELILERLKQQGSRCFSSGCSSRYLAARKGLPGIWEFISCTF